MTERKLDTIALFAALSLYLSIIEMLIPKPVPFFRIGLANLPLLMALPLFSTGDFVLLVVLKILGQAIVSGTLLSYVALFSAVGSLAAGGVMLLLRRAYPRFISLVGISVAGAFASNAAQLGFAALLIFGASTRLIAPVFLLVGTISGTVLGGVAAFMIRSSQWLEGYLDGNGDTAANPATVPRKSASHYISRETLLLAAGLAMIPPFILQTSAALKGMQAALFLLYGTMLGKRVKVLPGLIIVLSVCLASALNPVGEIWFYLGGFPVTLDALQQGFRRGLNLVGLVYLSRCTISSRLRIPGRAGQLLYRVFFYFEELSSVRFGKVESSGFLQHIRNRLISLDIQLLRMSAGGPDYRGVNRGEAAETAGLVRKWSPLVILTAQWGACFFEYWMK